MIELKHNFAVQNFSTHLIETYIDLYQEKHFSDITLISDDQTQFQSHKFILSSSSKVFSNILKCLPQTNSVIFLKGVTKSHLQFLLKFIYHGEVRIPYEEAKEFLATMESFETVSKLQLEKELKIDVDELQNTIEGFEKVRNVKSNDEGDLQKKYNLESVDPGNEVFTQNSPVSVAESEKIQLAEEFTVTKFLEDSQVESAKKKVSKRTLLGPNLKCGQCEYVACRNTALRNHINVIHLNIKESYTCDKCGIIFGSKAGVKQHKERDHDGIEFKCDHEGCQFTTRSKGWLKNHKEIHQSTFHMCDQCEYKSIHSINLRNHIKMHHSNFIRQCKQCDYKCKKFDSLKVHMQVQHEGMKIACDQCDNKFSRLDNLKTHIQTKHTKKQFKCDKCEFSTIVERKFKSHNRKHNVLIK